MRKLTLVAFATIILVASFVSACVQRQEVVKEYKCYRILVEKYYRGESWFFSETVQKYYVLEDGREVHYIFGGGHLGVGDPDRYCETIYREKK